MQHDKQEASVWRDLYDPGWREREAERVRQFLESVPVREPLVRIGRQEKDRGDTTMPHRAEFEAWMNSRGTSLTIEHPQAFDAWVAARTMTHNLNAARPPATELRCTWAQNGESDLWTTSCGKLFRVDEGTPSDNDMAHCCCCGKPLQEEPHEVDEGEDTPNADVVRLDAAGGQSERTER